MNGLKLSFLLSLFCVSALTLCAQPDSSYFQQQVNYKIQVTLDDNNHTLRGFETIEYKNNSPHALKYLVFHLWPNAYKNNDTKLAKQLLQSGRVDFYYASESQRGYIDSLLFKVEDDTLKWEYYKVKKEGSTDKKDETVYIDIAKINLKRPLKPDSTVVITTPFFVKIPDAKFSRLGHVNQSYQITQWYPKPAVYDRNGWNPMPYLNQGEFYSEFGDFDVSITVPSNYLVAATGELTGCPAEERMLELKAKETEQRFKDLKVNKIGNLDGFTDDFPASSTEWKTLRYTQRNVHDFAWFADKRWHVLKGEHVFDKSGKLVTLWSFFTTGNSRYWRRSIEYIRDAVRFYSMWNGEYPYSIVTAVDGTISAGGGMEYPTITNIGNTNSAISLETVIMHEVGHNWFYGILASNEREHPWMDEGMNSANEMRYLATKYPELTVPQSVGIGGSGLAHFMGMDTLRQRYSYYLGSMFQQLSNDDQPIEGKASQFTNSNYALMVYYKTATAFNYLRAYLGNEVYDNCMHAYFNAWKFKHPQPRDLQKIFERVSKKDLGWFFGDVLTTNKVIDYRIKKKKKPSTSSSSTYGWMKYEEGLVIQNKGGIAAPFLIAGITHDTIADKRWNFGFSKKEVVSFPNGNYQKIIIDPFYDMPEVNKRNNAYRYKINGHRLFPRTEKLKLKFLAGYDNPQRTMLYWSPVAGYNTSDGFEAGLALYNSVVFQKPFEFAIMPMYAFATKTLTGSASFKYNANFRNSHKIKNVEAGTNLVSYNYYSYQSNTFDAQDRFYRVDPYVLVHFKTKTPRSPITHSLQLKDNIVVLQYQYTDTKTHFYNTTNQFIDLTYRMKNKNTLMPQSVNATARYFKTFSFITADYTVSRILGIRKKKITARVYAGGFTFNNSNAGIYNLRGDGIEPGYDYTYASVFVDRKGSSAFWSQQFTEAFANFKAPTAYLQSDKWNAAINLYTDLPIPILKVFADAGIAPSKTYSSSGVKNTITAVSDAGFYVSIGNGILNIYLPLYISSNILNEYKINNYGFGHRIRFSLNIQSFTPQRIAKSVKLF